MKAFRIRKNNYLFLEGCIQNLFYSEGVPPHFKFQQEMPFKRPSKKGVIFFCRKKT